MHYKFNDYMIFDLNYATLYALANWLYYFSLEPLAAVRVAPRRLAPRTHSRTRRSSYTCRNTRSCCSPRSRSATAPTR